MTQKDFNLDTVEPGDGFIQSRIMDDNEHRQLMKQMDLENKIAKMKFDEEGGRQ